jgi:hypothetical protein
VISLIGTRPAIQVGRHQVIQYDTTWLGVALRRAASAAERHDFPFVDEIRLGIEQYLENKCPLRLLPLSDLYERMRHMLVRIGCETIADKLEPLAPPVTLSLVRFAKDAGNGFELAFFSQLRDELVHLREFGAEDVRFTGLRDAAQLLTGAEKWDRRCDVVLAEIRNFLGNLDREHRHFRRPLRLQVDAER